MPYCVLATVHRPLSRLSLQSLVAWPALGQQGTHYLIMLMSQGNDVRGQEDPSRTA